MKNVLNFKILKNSFSKFSQFNSLQYMFRNFSTISLITREGTVNRSANPNFNVNINWELSKVWVTPHNNSFVNSVPKNADFKNDTNEDCKTYPVGPLIQQIDFDRFVRKIGLTLSRDDNVYIQDGLYKGKKVRIVSSDKTDAGNASNIFEESQDFLTADLHLLYLTDVSEVGAKKFVFYDKKAKIVISNSKNLNNITKAIQDL